MLYVTSLSGILFNETINHKKRGLNHNNLQDRHKVEISH